MKLTITKIALIVNPEIDIEILEKMEIILLKSKKNSEMYFESFKIFKKNINYVADWDSFAKFMWYAFQTSTYYKDIKKNINNVYKK